MQAASVEAHREESCRCVISGTACTREAEMTSVRREARLVIAERSARMGDPPKLATVGGHGVDGAETLAVSAIRVESDQRTVR